MRKLLLFCGILFAFAAKTQAQTAEWEIYGGGDYLSANACPLAHAITGDSSSCSVPLGNGTSESFSQRSYGWHASIDENKTDWFGGVADFSGDYANRTINLGSSTTPLNVRFNGQAYVFLFGPRFYYRKLSRVAIFGEPMVGGVNIRASGPASYSYGGLALPWSNTQWAFAFGGGADYKITRLISIRGQADWIRSHFEETLAQNFQNSVRVSGGLVLTLGQTAQ